MISNFELTIPQLPLLPLNSFPITHKAFYQLATAIRTGGDFDELCTEWTIKHEWLNDQLKEIFLINHLQNGHRNDTEYYPFNREHHKQVMLTDLVVGTIISNTGQILNAIYQVKYLQTTGQAPAGFVGAQNGSGSSSFPDIEEPLIRFADFFNKTDPANTWLKRPRTDGTYSSMLLESEPQFFMLKENGGMEKSSLRVFVDDYGLFFTTALHIISQHSPEIVSISMQRWTQSINPS